MIKNDILCFKVSDTGICPNCKSRNIVKNGFTKYRKQQYYCKEIARQLFISIRTVEKQRNQIMEKLMPRT